MNSTNSNLYSVVIRTCQAPKSNGGQYRRPVRVLVVRSVDGIKAAYRAGDVTVAAEWSNVDSRYDGPRSAHGQALRAAKELVATLNAAEQTALSLAA